MNTVTASQFVVQGLRDQKRLETAAKHKEQFTELRARVGNRIGKILGRATTTVDQLPTEPVRIPTVAETLRAMEASEQVTLANYSAAETRSPLHALDGVSTDQTGLAIDHTIAPKPQKLQQPTTQVQAAVGN